MREQAKRAPAFRPVEDVRSARPYFLTRNPLTTLVRRVASIAALVLIDLSGLVIGLYLALVLRALIRDPKPILWNLLWDHETDWLPFLVLLLVLVFSRNRLYGPRELRERDDAEHAADERPQRAPREQVGAPRADVFDERRTVVDGGHG